MSNPSEDDDDLTAELMSTRTGRDGYFIGRLSRLLVDEAHFRGFGREQLIRTLTQAVNDAFDIHEL